MSMLLWKEANWVKVLKSAIRRGDRGGIVSLLSCIELHNARLVTEPEYRFKKIVLPFEYLMDATGYDYDWAWLATNLSSPCLEIDCSTKMGEITDP